MKKLFIAALLTLVGLAFTAPAFAIEHEFGGYWRVRMFTEKNFDGDADTNGITTEGETYALPVFDADSGEYEEAELATTTTGADIARADTRTRLYYTAVINDKLKFVNKFEMNAVWGDDQPYMGSYGDIGADGLSVLVKHTYAEFKLDEIGLFRVGTQAGTIQRGFVFSDDFSGVSFTNGVVTAVYCKSVEDGANAGNDTTAYHVKAAFDLDTVTVTPNLTYLDAADDDNGWLLGLDFDAAFGASSLWGTFIYEGGEMSGLDVSAYLGAIGATVNISDTMNIHGQAFYASGDATTDGDLEAFTIPAGQSYYWSEIMGLGTFDAQASNNSPGGGISNITALNLGVTFAATDKLKVSVDLWYAVLNEVASGDDELGTELDLKATYQLVDGLNLDLIGAYLFAGDATGDDNPWEVGTQLSLSF